MADSLMVPVVRVYQGHTVPNCVNRSSLDRSHTCVSSFTTTLDMRQKDVAYGSKVGNTTNPQFLEVEHWIKLSDKIAVVVKDLQTPFLPLIYDHEFSDYTLPIGANILSQKWRTKDLTASIRGRQLFRIHITYKAYCSDGYYGSECSDHCAGNPKKCVVNGHTYCKMGWSGKECDQDINECSEKNFCSHGHCSNTVGSFNCTCPPYVYGMKCQLDEDECLLDPCNGGECINKIGSYQCNCRPGTSGKKCEQLIGTSCNGVTCSSHGNLYSRSWKTSVSL
uniref:EGF-like domain-containing protein n=1 Tax=Magallana gigas TaxID=29159 RepID=A0A8W8LWS8_MAGGI